MLADMDTNKKFKWPAAMEEDLIDEVKKYKFLYDPQDPLHIKRTLKASTYSKISERMTNEYPRFKDVLTCEEVLRKFANLRKYYLKEAKKAKLMPSKSACTSFFPKWEHFKKLSFLDDYIVPTESTSNSEQFDEEMQDTAGVPSSSTETSERKKRRKVETSGSVMAKAAAALEKSRDSKQCNGQSCFVKKVETTSIELIKAAAAWKKVETASSEITRAAAALEKIANAPKETPEELFFRYYSKRILRLKNPMLKRKFRLELEELVSRYEEEDEELFNNVG